MVEELVNVRELSNKEMLEEFDASVKNHEVLLKELIRRINECESTLGKLLEEKPWKEYTDDDWDNFKFIFEKEVPLVEVLACWIDFQEKNEKSFKSRLDGANEMVLLMYRRGKVLNEASSSKENDEH